MKRLVLGGLLLALSAHGGGGVATAQGDVDLAFQGRQAPAGAALVARTGPQGAVRVDDWRSRMNATHADNMARLRAQAAAGEAAHQARQQASAARTQAWAERQAASERDTGRFIDMIYERTTVEGGGLRTFVPYGAAAYTDDYGAVTVIPEGAEAPEGWRRMTPTYAAPH